MLYMVTGFNTIPGRVYVKSCKLPCRHVFASEGSDDAGLQAGSHGHAELLALFQKGVLPFAPAQQRFLHAAPAQAGGDGFDGAAGAGAVVAGADVKGKGLGLGFLQTGVVNPVEG